MSKLTMNQLWNQVKDKSPEKKETVEVAEQMAQIIDEIVSARLDQGLSQRDLAKLCNMKQSAIARMETLQAVPRLDTLVKIAYSLGVKITTSYQKNSTVCAIYVKVSNKWDCPDYSWNPNENNYSSEIVSNRRTA